MLPNGSPAIKVGEVTFPTAILVSRRSTVKLRDHSVGLSNLVSYVLLATSNRYAEG